MAILTASLATAPLLGQLGAAKANAAHWAPLIAQALAAEDIAAPRQVAAFLANVMVETGGLARTVEDLSYSQDSLRRLFGPHRISEADIARCGGRKAPDGGWEQRPDPEAIANALYGGAWGAANLGNTQPGDGWRFRGRGLLQLTGRANYARFGKVLGLGAEAMVQALADERVMASSAARFFRLSGCPALADADDFPEIRRRINGGGNGLKEALACYATAKQLLGGQRLSDAPGSVSQTLAGV